MKFTGQATARADVAATAASASEAHHRIATVGVSASTFPDGHVEVYTRDLFAVREVAGDAGVTVTASAPAAVVVTVDAIDINAADRAIRHVLEHWSSQAHTWTADGVSFHASLEVDSFDELEMLDALLPA